ncbi:hypothetical protein IPJ72_04405 [Candidatus Peregrinibacteria bacterium]|nr:MAG: hypothetical protein IPJ72_04405 [Candidatus Peregrinibacteria bacterium]
MKFIYDLKHRGIKVTPLLIERVLRDVKNRLTGKRDGVLDEPLDQIVANEYTVIRLEEDYKIDKY